MLAALVIKKINLALFYLLSFCIVCAYAQQIKEPGPPFTLLGTILEKDSGKSIAVIRDAGSVTCHSYKTGDKISGYQIAKIARGKITLLKNGKLSVLELPLGSEIGPVTIVSSDKRIIHRSALKKKIPDLNTALNQAIPIPYIESGKITGLKIYNVKDKSLADMAGIKEGDIVTQVNGEKIDSVQKALDLYHKFKNEEKVNVDIKRNKSTQTMTYYLE